MAWYKKIVSFLFEEDSEVIVEDELEKVDFSSVHRDDISEIVQEKKIERLRPIEPRPVEVHQETIHEIKAEPLINAKSIDIQVEPKRKVEPVIERRSKAQEVKKDFEFAPVISPMFGSKPEKSNKSTKTISNETATPKRKNLLGTVISPMYGQSELDAFEDEAQVILEEKKHDVSVVEEAEIMLENITLDELIMPNQEKSDAECIQFSLFGDNAPIEEIEKTSNKLND